jgi:GDP-L-fucose synthase
MEKNAKIYVAGHTGMVGSALVRNLKKEGHNNIIGKTIEEMDITNQAVMEAYFEKEKPEYVILAAARVGGIVANNTYRAEFIYQNLMMQNNIIHQSYVHGVKKLLFLGSSCIYPKLAPQPLKEEYLLTGLLEETNEPYAIAKIAGIKMCEAYRDQYGCNFIAVMPTNLYGPNDNYHPDNSHVLPAMIRKFHVAITEKRPYVEVWGTGTPRREFLYVDDLADAVYYLLQNYNEKSFVNIGWGEDLTIKELFELGKKVTGYTGELRFDPSKPDGTPQKLLDVTRLNSIGFKPKVTLEEGIRRVYENVFLKGIKEF